MINKIGRNSTFVNRNKDFSELHSYYDVTCFYTAIAKITQIN